MLYLLRNFNAGAHRGFRDRGSGTDRLCPGFPGKHIVQTYRDWMMVVRRKASASRNSPARKTSVRKPARKAHSRRWSQRVTEKSDALDLDRGVFKLTSAKKIAASLKRSAEHSARRKSGAYRSALSMLTFYVNRAGKNLPRTQRERLERAKTELKRQFHRE